MNKKKTKTINYQNDMKKIIALTSCLFILLNLNAQGIGFEETLSWSQIQAKAKAENKYIFVDCYATWCGPCKTMDKDVYPKENVGAYINAHFISVKVQIDTAKQDNEQIKKWYADAHTIQQYYKIAAVPTYLFFSPEGKIVHRLSGLMTDTGFIALAANALNPGKQYYTLLENYRSGKLIYSEMGKLALKVKQNGDKKLADSIAVDYKMNFLDKMSENELFTKQHLDFIGEFFNLINSKDKFFYLCYNQPEAVDKKEEYKQGGWADFQVTQTIVREEITPNLKGYTPDWSGIHNSIKKKFAKVDANLMVLDAQINYYKKMNDWVKFAAYKTEKVKSYLPKTTGMFSDAFFLNNDAWDVFLHCSNKKSLEQALNWVNIAIKLEKSKPDMGTLDTKANILYKLGKVKEAIDLEEKAVKEDKGYAETLKKMKEGTPTWSVSE